MKNTLKPSILFLFAFVTFAFSSCESLNETLPAPDLSVVEENTEANMAFEDLDNITLTVLSNSGLSARTNVNVPSSNLCEGALVTIDEETKKITVDFGEGCTSSNGMSRKGIINLAYTGNLLLTGAKVTTTFDGYEVNGKAIEGTRTIINKGVNGETNTINLEVTIQNAKVTWSDGKFLTLTSDQLRDLKLGTQGEYETSVTGTANGTSRSGFEYTSSISETLVYAKNCLESGVAFPLTGIIEYQFRGIESSIDYGDGECDKSATIFYPNGSKELILD